MIENTFILFKIGVRITVNKS